MTEELAPKVVKVRGLKSPRMPSLRPPNFTHKGQAPLRPFSGNTMIIKRSSGPLSEFLAEADREKIAGDDPMFIAMRALSQEMEKESGIVAAIQRAGGKVLSSLGKKTSGKMSNLLSRGGAKASDAASKRYTAAAQKTQGKLIRAEEYGPRVNVGRNLAQQQKYTPRAAETADTAREADRGARAGAGNKPPGTVLPDHLKKPTPTPTPTKGSKVVADPKAWPTPAPAGGKPLPAKVEEIKSPAAPPKASPKEAPAAPPKEAPAAPPQDPARTDQKPTKSSWTPGKVTAMGVTGAALYGGNTVLSAALKGGGGGPGGASYDFGV